MKVRDYRVFCIDREEGVNDLIKLIKNSPAKKMALVVQNGFLLLNSEINLKLIKKYAAQYRKKIVFINPDPFINEKVKAMGFKIYPHLEALELVLPFKQEAAGQEEKGEKGENIHDKDWMIKEDKKKKERRGLSSRFYSLLLIMIILGLAYFYFLYPTATIEIRPIMKELNEELQITGSPLISRIDWENSILPLHLTEMKITGEEEIMTTGIKLVGNTPAQGVVKFINEDLEAVEIPAGTIVKTEDGIRFKTLKSVTVPGLEVDYLMDVPVGMKAGQVEVEIEALEKGSKGNVSIGRVRLMEKELEKVHVVNPEPIRGGEDKRISIVSEDDLERAKESIEAKLKTMLLTEFYQKMGGNYRIIEEELVYKDLDISLSHQVGDVADTLKVQGTLTASAQLVKNSELDRLVTNLYQKKLPEGYRLMNTGININNIRLEEKEANLYNIELELQAPVIPEIDADYLVRQLMGLEVNQARKLLEEREDIKDFYINSGSETLPRIGFALKVIVTEPEEMRVFNFSN